MKRDFSSPLFSLRPLWLLPALLLFALPALAETVNIGSADDWAAFANRVNNGEPSLDAKLTADVKLTQDSPFVGADTSRPYAGTFDGNGHTLTVNWRFTDGTQWVAPFRFTSGCLIQNLHVTGSLESNGKFVAGFVGECLQHNSATYTRIQNCRSSVTIICTLTGDATSAGFVGHVESSGSARVRFDNCLFDGSLLGPTANCCGGFVGYRPNAGWARYFNSLFAPQEITIGEYNSYTFSRGGLDDSSDYYYMRTFGAAQGTDASAMSAETLVSKLGSAWTVANGKAALALFPYPTTPSVAAVDGFVYQGALKNVSGAPLTGRQTVQFRLYDAATGGTPLWGRSCAVQLNEKGLFNAELSDKAGDEIEGVNGINLASILARNSSSTLYVGVTVVGADGEIAPRQRLLSVPYAAFAADSGTASGNFAVAGKLDAAGLAVSGQADIAGKATVKGNAAVKGKLSVSGKILGPGSRAAYGTAPVGAIVIWSGAANRIPDGWKLCDGDNGTPDLRGRFVVGYDPNDSDYNAPGRTGGEKTHTLNVDQLPSHSHNTVVHTVGYALSHNDSAEAATFDSYKRNNGNRDISGDSTVGGQAHENRPPYYTLCYIMRVK
ncbi:MAG: hypothetical protein IJT88_04705 [Kiritimatiellae bacterium]|nr:hypothetical protein [Kiritimatiellia bacterium]